MFKSHIKDYQILEELGSGSFATVYKAKHKQTQQLFAIKRMNDMPRNDQIAVKNQIQLLKKMIHPNIIRYETDFNENGKWYIVFQYCGKGDLQHFRKKNGKIPEQFAKNVVYCIIQAVAMLHQNNIVHRDLKLDNILINDNFQIKLADFGFSKDNQSGLMSTVCGTPLTMAPQILQRQSYDQRCDTWSLGVLLYQLIYNKPPFYPNKQYGKGVKGLINAVLNAKPVFDEDIQISSMCKDIIQKCLQKKMKNRPTVIELRSHPWFKAGVRSTIRKNYLTQSFLIQEDESKVIVICKAIFNEATSQCLKRIFQKTNLTESGVKQILKSLLKNYPQDKKIQVLFLLKVIKTLNEISCSFIKIKVQTVQFKIRLDSIQKFNIIQEDLKEFLNKEIKCRNNQFKNNVNLQKEIVKFITFNANSCFQIEEINSEKAQVINKLSDLCNKQIQQTTASIGCCFTEKYGQIKKPFDKYISKLSNDKVIELINGICQQVPKGETNQNWIIGYDFEYKKKSGLEYFLGQILRKVIKVNNNDQSIQVDEFNQ